MTVPVRVRRLPHGADLPLPSYQSDEAAGLDVGQHFCKRLNGQS